MATNFSAENLPNRFDYKEAQPRLYAMWESRGYFHTEPDERVPFTIVIPPPNVTGALHLGHALNNTLQDVVIRFRRMQGFNTLWMPGTDHAGIATQAVVEKRLREEEGQTRHDLGRDQLVERIWAWKEQYEKRILAQLKQLGCSCDWQRTRFTLDETCARAVRQTFFALFSKQLIYRGKRLVNWDSFLQTAVSDDEVFRESVAGSFWHFRYPVINPKPGEPSHVSLATTRPETMLGDTAVAVHPDPAAALRRAERELQRKLSDASAKDKDAVQAELDNIATRRESMLSQLEQLRDMALDGRHVMLPLMDRPIPLVADIWAKPELGSGCVKITPAHDPNDYEVAKRCDLPMINILNPNGTLNGSVGKFQGLNIHQARKQVVKDMDGLGLVVEIEDREIELAHSDRSKTPIEPFLADQWFVKMDDLAQSAMDAVSAGRVKIYPPRYAKGYHDWLAEKRDWPVSRQLWWGHRIPVWSRECWTADELQRCLAELEVELPPETTAVHTELNEEREQAIRRREDPGLVELSYPYATIHVCLLADDRKVIDHLETSEPVYAKDGSVSHHVPRYEQSEDVLDTWFSSALWPHSTLGWPENTKELEYYYPTSTLITSRDIITLWVARMVLAGLHNMGDVPFREVFIHPKILDGYGETMSKSKGNGVDPLDVIEKFGADALRFGITYLCTETQDVRLPVQFECPHCATLIDQTKKIRELPRIDCPKCGQAFSTQWARAEEDTALPRGPVVSERFEGARNFCNKLWNVARLTLMNLDGYSAAAVGDDELAFEDRWILSRLATVTRRVTEGLDRYKYAQVSRELKKFAWDEFCSVYAEMIKGRVEDPTQRKVTQRVLAHVLDSLLRLVHPIMPFLTEEIWQLLGQLTPQRGLAEPVTPSECIAIAPWPEIDAARQDAALEAQFAQFQAVLGGLREIRSSQRIEPKQQIEFSFRCEPSTTKLLKPMEPFFLSMANAVNVGWGRDLEPPETSAKLSLEGAELFVDLKDLIDVDAEIARLSKQEEKLQKAITGKENKLGNASFVERAPAQVVQKERDRMGEMRTELSAIQYQLKEFRAASG